MSKIKNFFRGLKKFLKFEKDYFRDTYKAIRSFKVIIFTYVINLNSIARR